MRIYRLFSITAALLIPQSSFSDLRLEIEMGFPSEIAAVRAAANTYNPLSITEDREYMGAILKRGSDYGYTVTGGGRSSDRIRVKIDGESWRQTIGLWHTHGSYRPSHRYFSRTDTRTATSLNLPFYLADYTGYLKVYMPGDTTLSPFAARRLGLSFEAGFAIGRYVHDQFDRPIRVRTRG